MRPKIGFALLALSVLAAPILGASEDGPPARNPRTSHSDPRERRIDMQLRQLAANLDLTEEQKTQLKPIIENKMNEMRALRMDQSLDPEEKEGRLASMQDSYRSQIQSVLTSAQIQKLAELREKRRLASQETLTQKRKGKVPIDDEDQ